MCIVPESLSIGYGLKIIIEVKLVGKMPGFVFKLFEFVTSRAHLLDSVSSVDVENE